MGSFVLAGTNKAFYNDTFHFQKLGFLGASITNGSGSSNAGSTSYRALVAKAVGVTGRVSTSYEIQAFPGSNAAVITASGLNALIDADIDVLVIGPDFGTNDSSLSISDYMSQVYLVIDTCLKNKILPVLCLTMPQGVAASYVVQRNTAILSRYRTDSSVVIIDTYTPMLDTTTGILAAANDSGDDIHPNDTGHALLSTTITTKLNTVLTKPYWPVQDGGVGSIANPTMLGTTTATSWAAGAGTFTGAAFALAAGDDTTDLPVGRWATVHLDGNSSTGYRQYNSGVAISVVEGDVLSIFAVVKQTGTGTTSLKLIRQGSVTLTILHTVAAGASQYVHAKYTIPAGATSVYLALECTVTAGQDLFGYIGAADIYKVASVDI